MHNLNKSISVIMWFVLFIGLLNATQSFGQVSRQNVKLLFEAKYNLWREWLRENVPSTPSSIIYKDDFYNNEPFKEIVRLGVPAIPYIIEKQQEDHMLGYALYQITKWKWHTIREGNEPSEWVWTLEEFPDIRGKGGPPDSRKLWLRWWKEGRKLTEQRFEKLYSEWKELKKQNKDKQAREKYQRIIDLGIAVLPTMTQKVQEGDTGLISAISKLTDGEFSDKATAAKCLDWWEKNKENWLIPFPNKKPIGNAGKDVTVVSGDMVQLDGSASTDPDKDKLTYKWTQTTGLIVALSDATAIKPTFVAPEVQELTLLTFQLTVSDGSPKKSVHPSCESGQSDPDTVNVTVKPKG